MTATDTWDADTPPPRRVGDPLPRYCALPAGEDPVAYYRRAQKEYRIPPGCELLRFTGTREDSLPAYVVCQTSEQSGYPAWPLGSPGTRLNPPAAYRLVATFGLAGRMDLYTVWELKSGGAS